MGNLCLQEQSHGKRTSLKLGPKESTIKGVLKPRGRPKGPFSQHRKLDALRSLLQRHPGGLTIYELASKIGVSTRQIRRYLREIEREFDLMIEEHPKGPATWKLSPNEVPRRVELRRMQAYAILATKGLFESTKGSAFYEEVSMAYQKLLAVARRPGRGPNAGVHDAPLDLEERFVYVPSTRMDMSIQGEILDTTLQALADCRPVLCKYPNPVENLEESFTFCPYALVLYKESIYFIGTDLESTQYRTLMLDSIFFARIINSARFKIPSSFSIKSFLQGPFGIWENSNPQKVVIDFDATIADFLESRFFHASQEFRRMKNGHLRLSLQLTELREVPSWVLGFGPMAKVIRPASVIQEIKLSLKNTATLYRRVNRPK